MSLSDDSNLNKVNAWDFEKKKSHRGRFTFPSAGKSARTIRYLRRFSKTKIKKVVFSQILTFVSLSACFKCPRK